MNPRDWTPEQVRELAALAKKKGYTKGDLAGFVGVDPATLSVWMNEARGRDLPRLSRNALNFIEGGLSALPDKVLAPKKVRRKGIKPEPAKQDEES